VKQEAVQPDLLGIEERTVWFENTAENREI
jgi:hypothetical protein